MSDKDGRLAAFVMAALERVRKARLERKRDGYFIQLIGNHCRFSVVRAIGSPVVQSSAPFFQM